MNRSILTVVVCLCSCLFSHFTMASASDGLLAYYPFNGDAQDESGNAYDGAVFGASLTEDRFGDPDSAYYFDGVNDRIDLPVAVLDFERTNTFSQSFWLKSSDTSVGNNIIAKMQSSGAYRGLIVVLNNGHLKVQLINDQSSVNKVRVDGTTMLSDNQWHHIVVTYDGSSLASGVALYVDGTLENMVVVFDSLTGSILNNNTPTIGSRNSTYRYYYKGIIDDVHLYNRVLSEDEVFELYNGGSAQLYVYSEILTNTLVVAGEFVTKTITVSNAGNTDLEFSFCPLPDEEDGLVAYYPFDGTAIDASGNDVDGVLEGALPAMDRHGNEDGALWFDENRYVRTTASSGPADIVGQISFASWVYPTQLTVKDGGVGISRTMARKRSWHNSYGYNFVIRESGQLGAAFGNSSTPYVMTIATGMDPIQTNSWSHVAMTFDGSTVCFYVNGELVDVQPCSVPLLSTMEELCIGRLSDTEDRACFYGAMDDLYLFNSVLSSNEVFSLYTEETDCTLPDWLAVDPESGSVASGESMDVTVTFNASNLVAGDYVEHMLQLFSNDPEYPVVEDLVSMWVVPSAPELYPEPLCTVGRENEIAWAWQDGPVEYWVEAVASMHYTPSSRPDNRPVPTGWDQKNLAGWSWEAGWMSSTSYLFADLRLNTVYLYRVKASVVTEIGRLEGEWSDWMPSCQVPVLPRALR